jgi:hypothetical protein
MHGVTVKYTGRVFYLYRKMPIQGAATECGDFQITVVMAE